ncbi:MAG: MBL fold metallo-hydrolase [Firmicutes bacterium]|nr:MBL fold metallo-hydrolase [Bacillota bacterium]
MREIHTWVDRETAVTAITVSTPFPVGPVNMYLLEKEGSVVLIDAAVDSDEAWNVLLEALQQRGLTIESIHAIFLTHHHVDHVGLVNRVVTRHPVPVYVHPRSIPRLLRDPAYLEGRLRFFEKLYDRMGCGELGANYVKRLWKGVHSKDKIRLDGVDLRPVEEGETIPELSKLELYYVPGHAVDHLMAWDRETGWLFGGDLLLPHISSNALVEPDERTWRRMKTVCQYRESMLRCAPLPVKRIFPGHGSVFTDHASLIDHRIQRIDQKAERLRQWLLKAPKTPMELCEIMYPSKLKAEFPLVASEVMGLLDYLDDKGQIEWKEADGTYIYHAKEKKLLC